MSNVHDNAHTCVMIEGKVTCNPGNGSAISKMSLVDSGTSGDYMVNLTGA